MGKGGGLLGGRTLTSKRVWGLVLGLRGETTMGRGGRVRDAVDLLRDVAGQAVRGVSADQQRCSNCLRCRVKAWLSANPPRLGWDGMILY